MPKFLWTQKQDIGPKPRRGHALAFDSQRQRTVLYGGDTITAGLLNDTWEWDGENWTQITDLGPSPRYEFAMSFDENRNKIVLFGGITSEDRKLNDTWEWDGENWTQVEDGGPASRSGHAMTFDPTRGRVVLVGGSTAAGLNADTWEWDGNQWTQTGAEGVPARTGHMLAYDKIIHQLILFGGWNGDSAFNDTWAWNGETWTQVAEFGPAPRHHAGLVSTENQITLFGGLVVSAPPAATQANGDTWEWFNKKWIQRTDFGPTARWGHAMTYDNIRRQLVMFGGLPLTEGNPADELAASLLNDTWEHVVSPLSIPDDNAAVIEAFILSPDTATYEAVNGGHPFTITGSIRLNAPFANNLNVTLKGDEIVAGVAIQVLIPANTVEVQTNIPLQSRPPGTYTIDASLLNGVKSAMFTIT